MIEIVTAAIEQKLTTVATVKADLGITGADQDVQLGALIDQASAAIASWCGRTFGVETVRDTLVVDSWSDRSSLLLGRWPVVAVTALTVAGVALEPEAYVLNKAKGDVLNRGSSTRFAPWPLGETIVTYSTGYVLPGAEDRTLPHEIERACLLMVRGAHYATGRDPALRSEETSGVATFTYFAAIDHGLPLEAQALLSPYRLINVG